MDLLDAGFDVTLITTDGKTSRDICNDGNLVALIDNLYWIRQCFGKDMVPKLAKNPKTVSFLADPALYAILHSIQLNPYKFVKHQDNARVLDAFFELKKLTSPYSVQTSSTYQTRIKHYPRIFSIQSAVGHILHTLQIIKGINSDLLDSAKVILELSLDFQTNRELVLATGIIVGRIVNQLNIRDEPMQDFNILQIFEEIRVYLQSTLRSTPTWKLLIYSSQRQATIQVINTKIVRLQDRLRQAANYLNVDLYIQVVGYVNDRTAGFKSMIETMNDLDKRLEAIANLPSLRQQMDKFDELKIQMQRGLELHTRQVEVENITQNKEFEYQIKICQNQIEDTAKIMSQKNKTRYGIEKIESWMLSSDDIDFEPDNINSALGRGGFATVFRGLYHGQYVAVKRFDQILVADSPDLEKLIVKEVKAWKDISREPYILTLIGVCTKIAMPILVSELCQTNIRRYVRYSTDALIPMIYQFACGLLSLHNVSIIHRDLKGDNVLITFQNTVAIADFGLSRAVMTLDESKTGNERCGTLNWMSPEQYWTPDEVTVKSDIWSFGMTMWEVLCNDIPYKDYGTYEIPDAIVSDDERPNKPEDLSLHLEPLWKLITMCWQVDPAARPFAVDIVDYLKKHYGTELEL
ncbi:hypothetical protein AeRB84_008857 [Aphanomyces euteiches]|nr:hypothetical protein AeRB84_008857 [Aphanomyces euteiches]